SAAFWASKAICRPASALAVHSSTRSRLIWAPRSTYLRLACTAAWAVWVVRREPSAAMRTASSTAVLAALWVAVVVLAIRASLVGLCSYLHRVANCIIHIAVLESSSCRDVDLAPLNHLATTRLPPSRTARM